MNCAAPQLFSALLGFRFGGVKPLAMGLHGGAAEQKSPYGRDESKV